MVIGRLELYRQHLASILIIDIYALMEALSCTQGQERCMVFHCCICIWHLINAKGRLHHAWHCIYVLIQVLHSTHQRGNLHGYTTVTSTTIYANTQDMLKQIKSTYQTRTKSNILPCFGCHLDIILHTLPTRWTRTKQYTVISSITFHTSITVVGLNFQSPS